MSWYTREGQRAACRDQFSPSTMWVPGPGVELTSSGLPAKPSDPLSCIKHLIRLLLNFTSPIHFKFHFIIAHCKILYMFKPYFFFYFKNFIFIYLEPAGQFDAAPNQTDNCEGGSVSQDSQWQVPAGTYR